MTITVDRPRRRYDGCKDPAGRVNYCFWCRNRNSADACKEYLEGGSVPFRFKKRKKP